MSSAAGSAVALRRRTAASIRRRRIGSASRHLLLLAFTLLSLLPIYFMVVSALKTKSEFTGNQMGLPLQPSLASLTEALAGGDLYRWLLNSFLITTASVLVSTVLAALAAYPLSLMRWPSGRFVLGLLIALLVVPPIVLIIPLFQMVVDVNQLNTYHSVIIIYTGIMLPFSTFLLCSFFATISRPLLEAARLDGAGSWRIFWEIVLPLSGPALVTVVIVQALWVWNEVLIAVIFLQGQSLRTLMVGLTLFNSRYRLDVPVVMAGMLWATLPMLALYLLGQRFFIRGLTAGGVKG
ncbi:MAG TPA: carbohydrate ABC transporter permease [Verrucomicrobiae bacterium]|jgi:raffinose/stachyose/melibiose transport system permease protein|nr:carbohydrate ABC transporter permease [Verrucomicrobiae bacterium]